MSKENFPGLYVHIPFCLSKCPYCDFYSETGTSMVSAWSGALEQEMLLYKDNFQRFNSLYIGGGTPTILEETVLINIFDHLYHYFQFTDDAEITVEANPGDVTGEKLQTLKGCGVNRISLGVQSFDEKDLTFLKRRHTAQEAVQALDLIRSHGFPSLGIDLIYGIPGQTPDGWLKILERAVSFHPEHISCYQLTLAEKTELWEMLERGMIKLPDESEGETLFLATAEYLKDHRYLHYEISNFAHGEENRSRHNQKYWQHTPYLGLGPSAHSFQQGKRWWNVRSVEDYCHALKEGRAPVSGEEQLTGEQRELESLYLGLRTSGGVTLSQITTNRDFKTLLMELLQADYVKVIDQKVVPTTKGFLVADRLPLAFV
jgi:oxygen-independent coproporphyrinogen-3 oxidase